MSEILVVARARIRPDKREAFIGAARDLAVASRAEAGCLEYRFYEDIAEPGVFATIERWADYAAGQAHFESPHVRAMMAAVPEFVAEPPTITVYPAVPAERIV